VPFTPISSRFKEGDFIPKTYGCDGSDGAHEEFLNGGVGHHYCLFRST